MCWNLQRSQWLDVSGTCAPRLVKFGHDITLLIILLSELCWTSYLDWLAVVTKVLFEELLGGFQACMSVAGHRAGREDTELLGSLSVSFIML